MPTPLPQLLCEGRGLMPKKIAVLVRDRQEEALRMAVGLTLENDEVDVFVMDRRLEENDDIAMNLEFLRELNVRIYSNNPQNNFDQMSTEAIGRTLLNYDSVIPY